MVRLAVTLIHLREQGTRTFRLRRDGWALYSKLRELYVELGDFLFVVASQCNLALLG